MSKRQCMLTTSAVSARRAVHFYSCISIRNFMMEDQELTRKRATVKNKGLPRQMARRIYSPHSPQVKKNKDTCLNSLVASLRESQLGCWLKEICERQWSDIALQFLKAFFFLLFVWLLAELHMALPCLFVYGCLFDGPLRRAVDNAWTWTTAHVRGRVVEQTPHADGCTKGNETQPRDCSVREK